MSIGTHISRYSTFVSWALIPEREGVTSDATPLLGCVFLGVLRTMFATTTQRRNDEQTKQEQTNQEEKGKTAAQDAQRRLESTAVKREDALHRTGIDGVERHVQRSETAAVSKNAIAEEAMAARAADLNAALSELKTPLYSDDTHKIVDAARAQILAAVSERLAKREEQERVASEETAQTKADDLQKAARLETEARRFLES